jgi:hypothetical protein
MNKMSTIPSSTGHSRGGLFEKLPDTQGYYEHQSVDVFVRFLYRFSILLSGDLNCSISFALVRYIFE